MTLIPLLLLHSDASEDGRRKTHKYQNAHSSSTELFKPQVQPVGRPREIRDHESGTAGDHSSKYGRGLGCRHTCLTTNDWQSTGYGWHLPFHCPLRILQVNVSANFHFFASHRWLFFSPTFALLFSIQAIQAVFHPPQAVLRSRLTLAHFDVAAN